MDIKGYVYLRHNQDSRYVFQARFRVRLAWLGIKKGGDKISFSIKDYFLCRFLKINIGIFTIKKMAQMLTQLL